MCNVIRGRETEMQTWPWYLCSHDFYDELIILFGESVCVTDFLDEV